MMRSGAARKGSELSTVRQMVRRLGQGDKLALFAELRRETWAQRFADTVGRVRERAGRRPVSDEEIRRECETVRARLFAERAATRRR